MTSHRIGVNLRVSGNCDQGARKYMEDNYIIKFLKKDTEDYEFAYFGIFDGHGGPEASAFCKENLLNEITKYDGFWTDDDEQVLAAIRKGFLDTHNAMWNVLESWPKTVTGLPSTAGSTATIAIIKQGKLYTGHVGDSALVLGENSAYSQDDVTFQAVCITKEHKPDDPDERLRIEDAGGEVINKSGVPRVVWSRPKTSHKGPVRRSTQIDQIPFLAVARSLGDLWSYDYYTETYVVSPDPDVSVMKLDPKKHRCLVLASDGLWNMLTPEETVNVVMDLESQFEQKIISDPSVSVSFWSNPAEQLVSRALNKWRSKSLKADNTSCVAVLIDPLGPSKLTLLRQKRQALLSGGEITAHLSKVPKISMEAEHRNRVVRNKNTNCTVHDNIVTANSFYQLKKDEKHLNLPSLFHVNKSEQMSSQIDSIKGLKNSVQTILKPTVKWNLRHSLERLSAYSNSSEYNSGTSKKINLYPNNLQSGSSKKCLNRKSEMIFTKLITGNNVTNSEAESKHKIKLNEKMQHLNSRLLIEDFHDDFVKYLEEKIEIEESEGEFESYFEKSIPDAPVWSNYANIDIAECNKEHLLHNLAKVSNKEFSMASNCSTNLPLSSSSADLSASYSAPTKLASSRVRPDKSSNKKLVKAMRKVYTQTKTTLGADPKPALKSPTSNPDFTTIKAGDSCAQTESSDQDKIYAVLTNNGEAPSPALKVNTKSQLIYNNMTSVINASFPKQVLNSSKSVNDILTPKNKFRNVSVICPVSDHASIEVSKVPEYALNTTASPDSTTADVNNHLFSSSTTADNSFTKGSFTDALIKESSIVIDGNNIQNELVMLNLTGPLKQLNKTGLIRKVSSKRWGRKMRVSNHGIGQILHQSSNCKSYEKLSKMSTGNSAIIRDMNSLSDDKLNNVVHTIHPENVTVDALEADANETHFSTNSGDSSILAEQTDIEQSMNCKTLPRFNKHHSSLLQKTKLTLRQAGKLAKKTLFPENKFHKTERRKRSASSISVPQMKRQKQLETNRT